MKTPEVDAEGYLIHREDWSTDVAVALAAQDGILLTELHLRILTIVRSFYQSHDLSPNNRALVKLIERELGQDIGNSAFLMHLFGGTPAKTVARISGLPRPLHCL